MSQNELRTKAANPTDCCFGEDFEGNAYHKPLSKMVHILVGGTTGCHGENDEVMMFDGSHKKFCYLNGGEEIMGDDGTKRTVLLLKFGKDEMFNIICNNGIKLTVNKGHLLHLWDTMNSKYTDMLVADFINMNTMKQGNFKLVLIHNNEKSFIPFNISYAGFGDYYGFTCDGNHRYLTADGIVENNSGKSASINFWLISILSHATPHEVRISWIDPKKVEATAYKGLPHCPIDPVTNTMDAYGLIAYAVWEMERRYKIFEKLKLKQLSEYNEWYQNRPAVNKKIPKNETSEEQAKRESAIANEKLAQENGKLPYWIFVVDEYASLMDTAPETEELLKRIMAKGRAAGIISIVATQKPSADVISTTLRANFPSRVCLKVSDAGSSSIILGDEAVSHGADGTALRGYGDGYILDESGTVTRVQSGFITNEEIEAIFKTLRDKYADEIPKLRDYVPHMVGPLLTDKSKEYVKLNNGLMNYKIIVTDVNACRYVDNKTAFCEWNEGDGNGDLGDTPEAFPDNPEKWHVRPMGRRRGGHF